MKNFFYRVNKGDGILSVAKQFGVPPTSLIKDNELSREVEEGDIIFIKGKSGTLYDVKPFDTVDSVEAKFGVSAEKIKSENGVDFLFYGLTVLIPE